MCDEQRQCEHPTALAYDSARQRSFEYFRTPRATEKFMANAPTTVRHRAEANLANVGSKFRKRSPLFTSVLFNHYSTNAADG
ncbi:hypothetical protein QA635_35245 [Bradyrhizobium brasilense]|uniref:hypothetical protein n=1 Tax=Bradyrhizobium brasilense TaxID=1419277 RepID=UPI0024B17484|nr:hypothetical protein [Bradyrhizobium australafricanum]WFU31702.1 hypothetical protein QA635_35245 [Bradyrhizobium australafricanum]